MSDPVDTWRGARRAMTLYLAWRESCLRVDDEYAEWGRASDPEAADAFEPYAAALDGEQRAAEQFASELFLRPKTVEWPIGLNVSPVIEDRYPHPQVEGAVPS
jgi:hypothetical protein